jgi:3-dehydroquinate synthase
VPLIQLKTPSASYDIAIGSGLLPTLSSRLKKLTNGRPFCPFIVTQPEIWGLWGTKALSARPDQ